MGNDRQSATLSLSMHRLVSCCVLAMAASASAEPARVATTEPLDADARVDDAAPPPTDARSPHLFLLELGGKGGAYGLGYERAITDRLALGAIASFAVLRDQQITTVSPYLHATLLGGRRHALFGELGAVLVHSRIPSPVPDWDGTSDTGGGGVATLGYERAGRHLAFRAYGAVMAGEGGVAPWLGFAVGVRP